MPRILSASTLPPRLHLLPLLTRLFLRQSPFILPSSFPFFLAPFLSRAIMLFKLFPRYTRLDIPFFFFGLFRSIDLSDFYRYVYLIFRYFKQDRKARRFNIFGHARTTKRVSNFRADRIRDNFVNSFRLNTRIHYIYIHVKLHQI